MTIGRLARAVLEVMDRPQHPICVIGTRHGEKRFETLLSREEMAAAQDCGDFYRVRPDNRDLNYDAYFSAGERRMSELEDFNSENTRQLGVDEMAAALRDLPYVQAFLAGEAPDEN